MHYLREVLNIPVPKLIDYSCDPHNPVGAEYILMEKVSGIPLTERWLAWGQQERIRIIEDLLRILSPSLNIGFSHNGSLYFRKDLPPGMPHVPLNDKDTSNNEIYCIGPATSPEFWEAQRSQLNPHRGPCIFSHIRSNLGLTVDKYWIAICEREIQWLGTYAKPRPHSDPLRQQEDQENPQQHIELLKLFIKLAPHVIPSDVSLAAPALWHPDLHMENIMISAESPSKIVAIIDWQHAVIAPLYLHIIEPVFVRADLNFYNLDAGEIRELNSIYLNVLQKHNPNAYKAISLPYASFLAMLISRSGETWSRRNGIIRLRGDLCEFLDNWKHFGLGEQAPISFTQAQREEYHQAAQGQRVRRQFIESVIAEIEMSFSGEVSPEVYEIKKVKYETAKQKWIEDMKERQKLSGRTTKVPWEELWPFRYPDIGF